ncbi:MAG: 4Fe-4S binding protein [Planctomycetales bacterium]
MGPPPRYHASRCAAGSDGLTGCRLCVEACPYGAISPLAMPNGTMLHIDPGLCQRCGACTGLCPTSALERSFLPDGELYGQIGGRSAAEAVLILTCPQSRGLVEAIADGLSVSTLLVPSLLILNETHMLHALRCGAAGVALVGCPQCHYGSPALLETALQVGRTLSGDAARLAYIEDDGSVRSKLALTNFVIAHLSARQQPAGQALTIPSQHETRRAILASQLDGEDTPTESVELRGVPFATVTVEEVGCTLCGGCSRVCPTGALDYDAAGGRLTFHPVECINCSLCAQACPEAVLTLNPGLRPGQNFLERRTLVADEAVPCRRCGQPFIPKRLLEHVRATLSLAAGPLTAAAQQIDVCGSCRSVQPQISPNSDAAAQPVENNNCHCGLGKVSLSCASSGGSLKNRRGFLQAAGASLAGSIAGLFGSTETALAEPSSEGPPKRLGMVIDLDRCIGCHACTAACKAENHVPLGVFRDWVEEHVLGAYPHARPYFLPKLCNQCTDPGCLRACPTGAIFMRSDGIVDINHDICIGCRACNQACPYGATFMDPVRGTADKCNFCAHRVDQELRPACVDICPTQCRIFGDLNDAASPVSQYLREKPGQVLRKELGLGPNVQYVALPEELNR